MKNEKVLAGLDMGGGRITCVLGIQDEDSNTIKILAGDSMPCKGLKGGVVVDIRETSNVIAEIMDRLETEAGVDVDTVFMGVRGVHLNSANSHGAYNISRSDREITSEDVYYVIENAKAIPLSSDREILHVIPQSFSIDRQKGVPNPEGMEGSLLEVDVHILTASGSHLNNLTKSIAKAGLKVDETFYGMIALGECVLTPEEKELGAVLIDIGGETISLAIYIDGSIKYSKDLPYGSDLITRDIAYGLHTSRKTAGEIKEKYGVTSASLVMDDEEIPVLGLDKTTVHNVKSSFLVEIIQPRVEEIMEKVREELQNSRYADIPGIGVLSGGGSLLRGMRDVCAEMLGLREVRQAAIQRDVVMVNDEKFFNPIYSTALSLVIYSATKVECSDMRTTDGPPLFRKISEFFKKFEIFGRN
jgi:cell division protein FtsA